MPKAFSQFTKIYIYIDLVQDRLILDTINSKKTIQFISLFNKSFGKELKIFDKINKLSSLMTSWMEKSEELLEFSIAKSCVLQDPNKQTRRIRCQQQDLLSPNIQALLKDGYKVKQLALNWQNQIDFILDNRLLLSSIKLQDQMFEQEKRKEGSLQQQFCSKLLIELDAVSRLIEDLLQIIITNKAKELVDDIRISN